MLAGPSAPMHCKIGLPARICANAYAVLSPACSGVWPASAARYGKRQFAGP